jgi:NitT/TauT family transport system substrate-binding protein
MITSEPFYASIKGVDTRVLLLRDSGFDPYHVVYTSDRFAAAHPEIVKAFVRASIRGWKDYLSKNPAPAFELIKARNSRQTGAELEYARNLLIGGGYAYGNDLSTYGMLDCERMESMAREMLDLGVIRKLPDESVWSLAPTK